MVLTTSKGCLKLRLGFKVQIIELSSGMHNDILSPHKDRSTDVCECGCVM